MATTNLNKDDIQIDFSNDSIVIMKNMETIPGGRTLDVSGFTPTVIKAGHVIIEKDSDGELLPMPLALDEGIEAIGDIVEGVSYTNGAYTDVPLTGGSGSGATADITVAGTVVTVVTIVLKGTGYAVGDVLSAADSNLGSGGGTFFGVSVAEVGAIITGYDSLPGSHTYKGILVASILTAKPFAAVMVRGTVNQLVTPYTIEAAVKSALPLIRFTNN